MMHSNKSLFGGGKLEKYIDENPFSCKANEDVFQVLNNLLETGDANPHKDFIVYYKKNYFGVGKFVELIRYVNKLNSIDERSAKELQQFLIDKSKFHNLPFKINTYNKMAHSLGGDFCKTFNVNEDLSLIAIFDVSGKGITGALSTISISAFFSLISRTKEILKDPDTIVAELNNYIHDQTPFSIFITSVLMFIDQKAEKIIIYNLGHTPVLSYEINGAEITMVKIDAGLPPLGIDEELTGLKDGKTELPMSSNRKIVFYSDGLSEATNDYGVRYGEERTEKFFDENIQRENEEIISELQKDMESFLEEAPLTDDITVMISDFEPSVNESIQSKDEPLKTMQYLFKHSFDYSFHLFLNNSGRQEEKMYRCLLLFSAKKERFLIIRPKHRQLPHRLLAYRKP